MLPALCVAPQPNEAGERHHAHISVIAPDILMLRGIAPPDRFHRGTWNDWSWSMSCLRAFNRGRGRGRLWWGVPAVSLVTNPSIHFVLHFSVYCSTEFWATCRRGIQGEVAKDARGIGMPPPSQGHHPYRNTTLILP